MTYTELTFYSAGERCSAWHFAAAGDGLTGPAGRAVVVMAHGFGGTKDSGLQPFAERFSAAGLDVLAFDYRGFGASDGQPRQSVSVERQMADYGAAIAAAQRLPGVDRSRVVLWGSSFSGSHVLRVAAQCADVAAVIGMTPLTSGLAASRAAVAHRDVASALRWTLAGVKSRVAVAAGRAPTLMPLAAEPGEAGALALDGAYESYRAIAGPTWRNEVDSAIGMELVQIRTGAAAKSLKCPVLIQIADFDRFVPANSVMKTAVQARAQVHHYPCDHFDVWPGHDWFDTAADDQVKFLTAHL
ncbi:alpha/beta hydrolase [Mycolicibacterium neworleansense]|uniref:Alpha/beta hydrolase n=1 Tax=Mycolicibacterium neworleansense TaxID=146018 RepID=A0A0H5S2V3_9MYCO|nr:alpha/beta hydrolase [Mycolicibacterium neworleansense]MCV7364591.1 alpha/beta hydrolase [Mycolicibacterium neworleansense]CRZ15379.1 alpha/beta hydrolase [Mycolicibacterium neworleansense]